MIEYLKKRLSDYYTELMNTPGRINDVAGGFAIGVFVALSPWMGLHTVLVLALAFLFRKSLAAAILGSLVFNPFTGIFIFSLEFELGALISGSPPVEFPSHLSFDLNGLRELWRMGAGIFYPLFFGSLVLGTAAAVFSYFFVRRSLVTYRSRVYLKRHGDKQDQGDTR
jgi:uncharacterized protein (DUF2062 family)